MDLTQFIYLFTKNFENMVIHSIHNKNTKWVFKKKKIIFRKKMLSYKNILSKSSTAKKKQFS